MRSCSESYCNGSVFSSLLVRTQSHKTHTKTTQRHREKMVLYEPGRKNSEQTNPADTSILDFWPPESRENPFRFLKPPGSWHSLKAVPANEYSFLILLQRNSVKRKIFFLKKKKKKKKANPK